MNHYIIIHDKAVVDRIFNRLQNDGHYWHALGNNRIASIRDLKTGYVGVVERGGLGMRVCERETERQRDRETERQRDTERERESAMLY